MDYDKNLKDNITHNLFNDSAKNVLNWIKDNRDKYDWAKDPNAYEMTNLFLFAAKYRSEGEKIFLKTTLYIKLFKMHINQL